MPAHRCWKVWLTWWSCLGRIRLRESFKSLFHSLLDPRFSGPGRARHDGKGMWIFTSKLLGHHENDPPNSLLYTSSDIWHLQYCMNSITHGIHGLCRHWLPNAIRSFKPSAFSLSVGVISSWPWNIPNPFITRIVIRSGWRHHGLLVFILIVSSNLVRSCVQISRHLYYYRSTLTKGMSSQMAILQLWVSVETTSLNWKHSVPFCVLKVLVEKTGQIIRYVVEPFCLCWNDFLDVRQSMSCLLLKLAHSQILSESIVHGNLRKHPARGKLLSSSRRLSLSSCCVSAM